MNRKYLRIGLLALGIPVITQMPALAQPVEMAFFGKLFRAPGELSSEVVKNNLKECAPTVRRAIRSVNAKWGQFHYACINGVVVNLFVDPESPINKNPENFISGNLGLFDLQGASITIRFQGDKGAQFYGGTQLTEALIFRVTKDGKFPIPTKPNQVKPISTSDLERSAGITKKDHYIGFELGIIDPADGKVRIEPGIDKK